MQSKKSIRSGFRWKHTCAYTLGYLPRIMGNAVPPPLPNPFLREWLSCVHSVYPFQRPTGTVAETFIQLQSSYAELKWILSINVWMWVPCQGQSCRQSSHSQVSKPKFRTPLPLPNYTLWLWNSDILICIRAHDLCVMLCSWLLQCFL